MNRLLFLSFFIIAFCLTSCKSNQSVLSIPSQKSVSIDIPEYALYQVELNTSSDDEVFIHVVNKNSGKEVRHFEIERKETADVLVEKDQKIIIENPSIYTQKVKFSVHEVAPDNQNVSDNMLRFFLRNTSIRSIDLIIPNQMNPQLAPFSKTEIILPFGQEIFFRESANNHLLLIVDKEIPEDGVIDVAKLLKERKQEIDLN